MITGNYKTNTKCRMCLSEDLELVIDLGMSPLANAFISPDQLPSEKIYPLRCFVCKNCNLMQLIDVVDKSELFENYVYFFSAMPGHPKHFLEYADGVLSKFVPNKEQDLVVEIGSNDGLLSHGDIAGFGHGVPCAD